MSCAAIAPRRSTGGTVSRNHVVVISVLAGMIFGFQVALAVYLSRQNDYYMTMGPITAAGFAVAIFTICLLDLGSRLPGEPRDQISHR